MFILGIRSNTTPTMWIPRQPVHTNTFQSPRDDYIWAKISLLFRTLSNSRPRITAPHLVNRDADDDDDFVNTASMMSVAVVRARSLSEWVVGGLAGLPSSLSASAAPVVRIWLQPNRSQIDANRCSVNASRARMNGWNRRRRGQLSDREILNFT